MQTKLFVVRFSSSLLALVGLGFSACSSSSSAGLGDAGASDGGTTDAATSNDGGPITTLPDGATVSTKLVRVVAGNLSSGNNQNYDDGAGARIFSGLHADVILIQEFNVGDRSDAAAQTFVETVCGAGCNYFQESTAAYSIPNGIITPYPIIASGDWDDPSTTDREFAWAQIDIPGPIDLYVVSVHLLTSGATQRATQATNLVNLVNTNVPAGSYIVIGGDLNTENRDEQATATFASIVDTAAPYPVDGAKNDNTNQPRSKPHDWVMASPNLIAHAIPVKIGAQTFDPGLVVDTRVFTPIGDIAPALTTDSADSNMQHMAVVRDFEIPTE